ncbi:polysaccharide deacetylase family protein [Nitrospirillum sp. BR 11163]|uniref:polysaccharide deacetylase family protein n=1 Tax=Nitrospirillum sp. BR 11163 TaxID=3104323 RepID=UPI002AFE6E99|nr:polysaccharide deacetylase family protein [Nitrospirillum sp. BR 11163]MEA1671794.1 polysaccharide deacetylase family protein [Nitrospirillum sp. BR 11163]
MRLKRLLALAAGLMLTAAPVLAQQAPPQAAQMQVALTMDDLPVHGPLPPGLTRAEVAHRVLGAFKGAGVAEVYGFVNAKGLADEGDDAAQVLALWRQAGYPLGNHVYAHDDLHGHDVAAFTAAVTADEAALTQYMGPGTGKNTDWHWLRFPYLHIGETPEKRREVAAFLKDHGYRVAEVTLSFNDYIYNAPYARCMAKGDQAAVARLRKSYLDRAAESLTIGWQQAQALYGRDVPHVMLLHIGGFETVMLPELLSLMKVKGVAFVPLAKAEADPIYATNPDTPSNGTGSLLDREMTARNLPQPAHSADPSTWLDGLCR